MLLPEVRVSGRIGGRTTKRLRLECDMPLWREYFGISCNVNKEKICSADCSLKAVSLLQCNILTLSLEKVFDGLHL